MLIDISEENKKIISELELGIQKINTYYSVADKLKKLIQFKDATQKKVNFITSNKGKFAFYYIVLFFAGFIVDVIPNKLGFAYFILVAIIAAIFSIINPVYGKILNYKKKSIDNDREKIKKAESKIEITQEELKQAMAAAGYLNELLPVKYANVYAAKKIIEYLKTFRADNLKEAIKLYEKEEAERNKEAERAKKRKEENARMALAGVAVFSILAFFTLTSSYVLDRK